MTDELDRREASKKVQSGLFLVAGTSVACAVLHVFFPDRFDDKTAAFLTVAIVALVIQQVTKFKGFGVEFEKEVSQLKEDLKNVEQAVGGLEKGIGQGSRTAVAVGAQKPSAAVHAIQPDGAERDPDDPNKGRFGGQSESGDRKLTATITRDAGPKSARCRVTVRVITTNPSNPLTGTVTLHLHPTFGRWTKYDLRVKGGVAEDTFVSYGAFTVGAEADGGKTRLELDLVDVPGGTPRFYAQ